MTEEGLPLVSHIECTQALALFQQRITELEATHKEELARKEFAMGRLLKENDDMKKHRDENLITADVKKRNKELRITNEVLRGQITQLKDDIESAAKRERYLKERYDKLESKLAKSKQEGIEKDEHIKKLEVLVGLKK